MLSKESQKKLLKALGVPEADITALVDTDDMKETDIPAGMKIFTEADFNEALDNHHNGKKKALQEIFVKDLKAAAGLEYDGKTTDKFLEEYKTKVLADAGQSVDEKVKSRDTKITELQAKLTEKDGEITKLTSQVKAVSHDAELLAAFPKERDSKLSDSDYLTLIRAKVKMEDEEGKTVYLVDGKKLTDDKLNPLDAKAAMPHIFKEFNWLAAAGGAGGEEKKEGFGGGDSGGTPGVFNNMQEVLKHLESKGINAYSEEAKAIVSEAAEKNTNFVFN